MPIPPPTLPGPRPEEPSSKRRAGGVSPDLLFANAIADPYRALRRDERHVGIEALDWIVLLDVP